MSAPSSPVPAEVGDEDVTITMSPPGTPTRTVAMIKHHALAHRFDIERRISEAGFEIVKERQMEFDIETDPETMYELFGADYESFAEGPVWVYVLERRRAVEVWRTIMGHPDPEIARQDSPSSLRALYGLSKEQNAVMGAPDVQTAETQILSIFASSPPFPTTDLPEFSDPVVSDSSLHCEYQNLSSPTSGTGGRAHSERSSETRSSTVDAHGKPVFRARAIPATIAKPDIVPRMSRAAALRAGVEIEGPKHYVATAESLARTFANVPGHKRTETIHVASTAPPAVAPRMTRAASLRIGLDTPPKPRVRAATTDAANSHTFEGVPGHKRRETISVASTRPPAMAPRMNHSATLRVHKEAAPPSSFNIRNPTAFSRSSSRTSDHPVAARPASAAASSHPPVTRNAATTAIPAKSTRPNSALALKPATRANANGAPAKSATGPPSTIKPKPRPSVVQAPPSIAPRTNKSALLRAAKMANATGANGTNGTAQAKTPMKKVLLTRAVKVAV